MRSMNRTIWKTVTGTFGATLLLVPALLASAAEHVCDHVDTFSKLETCWTEVQKHLWNVELQKNLGTPWSMMAPPRLIGES